MYIIIYYIIIIYIFSQCIHFRMMYIITCMHNYCIEVLYSYVKGMIVMITCTVYRISSVCLLVWVQLFSLNHHLWPSRSWDPDCGQAGCRVNGLVVTPPPPPGEKKPPLGIPRSICQLGSSSSAGRAQTDRQTDRHDLNTRETLHSSSSVGRAQA